MSDDAQALRELQAVPVGLPDGLQVSWLGVSGYCLTFEGVSLFVDPYVSRVPLRSLLLRRRALPDPAKLDAFAAAPGRVAGILVGHTHFDHAVDAPALAGAPPRAGVRVQLAGPADAPSPRRGSRGGGRAAALV